MSEIARVLDREVRDSALRPGVKREAAVVWLVLGALAVLQLIPVWWFRYLPTQDGAAHVENAMLLRDLMLGRDSIYAVNREPVPNWLGHLVMAVCSFVMTGRMAEKILVSMYVIGSPVCAALAGRMVRKGGEWVGILVVPLVYSLALHKGLYNFCLSLAGWFLMVGVGIAYLDGGKNRSVDPLPRPLPQAGKGGRGLALVGLCVVALGVYFCHVVSLVMGVIVLAGVVLGWGRWRNWGMVAVALAPAVALAAWFFSTSHGGASDRGEVGIRLLRFFEMDVLASFRRVEVWAGIFYSGVIWGCFLAILASKWTRWSGWDWMLALVLVTMGIYLLAPNSAAGGGQIAFRLSLYPIFVAVIWMAGSAGLKWIKWIACGGAVLTTVGLLVIHWGTYARLNVYLKEYERVAAHVESGKTIAAVDESRDSAAERKMSWKVRPFWHAIGYAAAKKDMIDVSNYEIEMGYFPVVKKGVTEQPASDEMGNDVSGEEERRALAAEYVVVWDLYGKGSFKDEQAGERLRREFEVVYRSGHRWATVYRRKM